MKTLEQIDYLKKQLGIRDNQVLEEIINSYTNAQASLQSQLVKQQKRIYKTIEYIEKQLEDTKKCLEYAREYHNLNDTEKYTRDFNLYTMLLNILRGKDNE